MIKVAVIVDSLRVGGAQKLISAYAASASAHGLSPLILTLRADGAESILEPIRAAGIRVIPMLAASIVSIPRLRRLIDILKQEKVDIVQSHLIYSNILGALAAHFAGIPAIATLHSTSVRGDTKSRVLKGVEQLVLRSLATRILAVGRVVAEFHRGNYGDRRIDVIPNGVPQSEPPSRPDRDRLRHVLTGNGSGPIIITVGRFSQAKGYEDMLEAFHLLRQRDLHPKLLMVGSGGRLNSIQARIEELNLTQYVILAGERADIPQLLALSDVFASSSHREGLPLAVLEAMMAGLPVVATSVGDIPNVVTEETGVVVPPHRPDLLAAALEDLLKNPGKRSAMGEAAHRRALDEYSLEIWMKRHRELYRDVLSTEGRGRS